MKQKLVCLTNVLLISIPSGENMKEQMERKISFNWEYQHSVELMKLQIFGLKQILKNLCDLEISYDWWSRINDQLQLRIPMFLSWTYETSNSWAQAKPEKSMWSWDFSWLVIKNKIQVHLLTSLFQIWVQAKTESVWSWDFLWLFSFSNDDDQE